MQSIQLTLFDLPDYTVVSHRKSIIQYLTGVTWDNYLEIALRGLCSLVSTVGLIAITTMPCAAPEHREKIVETLVQRRRKKLYQRGDKQIVMLGIRVNEDKSFSTVLDTLYDAE